MSDLEMRTEPMRTITATYSPDDNKLRLTAAHRLDHATYTRVYEAGFRWAPKLEQFVAPAWTPQREDLALELAGEIADEDSTLMDRAEMRAERFEGYRHRRKEEAERARVAVSAIADNIPLGQPILRGHHSERHARRDQERIERGMRKAVDLWKTSQYWTSRAAAAIRHAKYKERPDVRHRRIKTLEADKRKWQRERETAEMWLRLWNSIDAPGTIKRTDGAPTTKLERARFIAGRCHLTVSRQDSRSWSPWDVLRPEEERSRDCPVMTPEDCQAAAREAYPKLIAHCDRWIAHLDNRLAYERAMLEELGGYQEPAKPKSKAELPILNYSGAVSYRNPYQRGEIVTGEAVGLTKAEWAAINSDYKGTRVSSCGTHRLRTTIMAPGRRHQLVAVYLTDSKLHPRPSAEQVAAKADAERAERERLLEDRLSRQLQRVAAQAPAPEPVAFQALEQQARAGVQVVVVDQLVPTMPPLAARMAKMADIKPGQRVLEPNLGTGNIARAVLAEADVELVGVEIHPRLVEAVRGDGALCRVDLRCSDFLACNGELGTFDRIVMNPPFANAVDIKHIRHALRLLRPGGVLVSLCANGPRQREALQPLAHFWEDLPAGTFKEAGTNVNVALLMIRAEGSLPPG